MGKNQYLAKLDQYYSAGFDDGQKLGTQVACDAICLVLRDKNVMGKDTFGAERIVRFIQAMRDAMALYHGAFQPIDEADYLQEQFDANLREALGGNLEFTFDERYPMIRKYDYKRGKWI